MKEYQALNYENITKEEYGRYYKVWEACQNAEIDTPEEVLKYLGIEENGTPIKQAVELYENSIEELEALAKKIAGESGMTYGNVLIHTYGVIKGVESITIKLNVD